MSASNKLPDVYTIHDKKFDERSNTTLPRRHMKKGFANKTTDKKNLKSQI